MKITAVNVFKTKDDLRIKGIASVTLDGCFVVRGIRIREVDGVLKLAMPSRKSADGEYYDIAHPINAETRKMFEDAIFEAYNKEEE